MSSIYIQEPPTAGKVLLKTSVGDIGKIFKKVIYNDFSSNQYPVSSMIFIYIFRCRTLVKGVPKGMSQLYPIMYGGLLR